MTGRFLLLLVASALLIGGVIFLTLERNQSSLLTLEGQITSIRLEEMLDGATLAIAEFELKNPSDSGFEVRTAELSVTVPEGDAPSTLLSKKRAAEHLEYVKNAPTTPLFSAGQEIKAGTSVKGMMLGRFEAPPADLKGKMFVVKITSVNGRMEKFIGKSK